MADQSKEQEQHQRFIATIFARRPKGSPSQNPAAPEQPPTLVDAHISDPARIAFADLIRSLAPAEQITSRVLSFSGNNSNRPRVVEATITLPANKGISLSTKYFSESPLVLDFEAKWSVSTVFQQQAVFPSSNGLCVFDMDSTLIQQEVIDEIARKIGVEKQVSEITHRAMNGELDFTASLKERVGLLKGVPATVFEELKSVITLSPGAKDLVKALKRLGFKTAVLSGGFTPLTGWQARQLGLDHAYANHLVVSEDGTMLTGEVTGEIVNAEKKREHVLNIAKEEGIPLDHVLVIGDGANDLPMMGVAGLGVAFNAKPKVQIEAPAKLNSGSLLDVLYLLGLTEDKILELVK
jgi:phosphoserine phosphatase